MLAFLQTCQWGFKSYGTFKKKTHDNFTAWQNNFLKLMKLWNEPNIPGKWIL